MSRSRFCCTTFARWPRTCSGPTRCLSVSGFELAADANGLHLTRGHCYVDGILVENDADDWSYTEQKDYPLPEHDPLSEQIHIHRDWPAGSTSMSGSVTSLRWMMMTFARKR